VQVRGRGGYVGAALLATFLAALGAPTPAGSLVVADRPALLLSATTTTTTAVRPVTTPAVVVKRPHRRNATVAMGGDLLWHDTVWASAAEDHRRTGHGTTYDFDPMFAGIRPLISRADLALCHEEVPFAAPGQPLENYPVFAAPPEAAAWIGSFGFDGCTTASNHSMDQGFAGIVNTADLLEAAGVAHIGTFRSAAERAQPVILTTSQGVKIGVVAGTFSLNGFSEPPGKPWAVSMWDAPNLLAQAHAARAAGADIVIVHLHGGTEYDHSPNADQIALVQRLTRSPDVDLVLGDHVHVVQPITKVNGKWVVYGMGNMVAQNDPSDPSTYQGIVVRFTFTERRTGGFRVTRADYVPIGWNVYHPGDPIRVHRLDRPGGDPAALADVEADVTALGAPPALHEG
jgi:poly-gamma-glutamate synthesis protein (capsule biosynthesis protein)